MYACIDLGGTNVRGTWIDTNGNHGELNLLERPKDLEGSKNALVRLIQLIKDQAQGKIGGIGLASAGPLDHRERKYLRTSNMPELDYFNVGDFLEKEFDIPVLMENDAQAAALGEVWMGGLASKANALILTLGTGVGSGVIMQGKIWRGGHLTGPELGHVYLGPGRKEQCGCGQYGCAETWLKREALIELFQKQGFEVSDLKKVYPEVEKQVPGTDKVMRIYGHRIGLYLSMLQVVFGFKNIGLSGGLSSFIPFCEQYIWKTLRHRFKRREWWLPETIASSPSPDMSALYGIARAWILTEREGHRDLEITD